MTKVKYLLIILPLIAFIAGCGGTFKPPSENEEQPRTEKEPQPRKEFKYDPLELKADQVIVPEKYTLASISSEDTLSGDNGPITEADSSDYPTGAYESYRIQLFTSKEYGPAFREMNIAREVFDKKVWFDYEVPYYKVRVGDFRNRMNAERYLPAAQEAGYKTAWVVKVNTNVKTLEDIYDAETPPVIDSLEQQYLQQDRNDTTNTDYETENQEN